MERAVIAMNDAGKSPWLAVSGDFFTRGGGGSSGGGSGGSGEGGVGLCTLNAVEP
jgi:hypothetical protein